MRDTKETELLARTIEAVGEVLCATETTITLMPPLPKLRHLPSQHLLGSIALLSLLSPILEHAEQRPGRT